MLLFPSMLMIKYYSLPSVFVLFFLIVSLNPIGFEAITNYLESGLFFLTVKTYSIQLHVQLLAMLAPMDDG